MATRKERIISAMNSRRRDARKAARERREEADRARKTLGPGAHRATEATVVAPASG